MGLADSTGALILNTWVARVIDMRERARYRNIPCERVLLRAHIEHDPIGALPVSAVTPTDVAAFWRRLVEREAKVPRHYKHLGRTTWGRPLSHATIRNVLSLLRAALTQAVAAGLIEKNPAHGVTVPRPLEATTELELAGVLEAEEERALLTVLARGDACVYAMARFALGVGVRRGELLSLRWSDVVLREKDPFVVVRDSGRGHVDEPAPTKGGAPRRVPIFGMALDAIKDLRPEAQWVFPGPRGGRRKFPPTRELREALREIGVTRAVRWHDLRHTCATALLEGTRAGLPPWRVEAVQQLLGHTSVTTTERYLHARGVLVFAAARATAQPQDAVAVNVEKPPGAEIVGRRFFGSVSQGAETPAFSDAAPGATLWRFGKQPLARGRVRAVQRSEAPMNKPRPVVLDAPQSEDSSGTRVSNPQDVASSLIPREPLGSSRSLMTLAASMRAGELVIVSYIDPADGPAMAVGKIAHLDSRAVTVHSGGRVEAQRIPLTRVTGVDRARKASDGEGGST